MVNAPPLLSLKAISFAYGPHRVLSDIGLNVRAGEVLAVLGPNGSGKSTLLKLMSGVFAPQSGRIAFEGSDLGRLTPVERARRIAALEQEHPIGFEFTVREVVGWGRLPHRGRLSRWQAADESAVAYALRKTGTTCFANRSIVTLSGGERQRAFIAMALAQQPQLLLLDEPTAHLDLKHQYDIMLLAQSLAQQGLAVVAALHDLQLATQFTHKVAVLNQGRMVAYGSPQKALNASLVGDVWQLPPDFFARKHWFLDS